MEDGSILPIGWQKRAVDDALKQLNDTMAFAKLLTRKRPRTFRERWLSWPWRPWVRTVTETRIPAANENVETIRVHAKDIIWGTKTIKPELARLLTRDAEPPK